MRKDFEDCRFVITLPQVVLADDVCVITFKMSAKMSAKGAIVRVKNCLLIDNLNREFSMTRIENGNQVLTTSRHLETMIHISRAQHRFGLRNARITLCIQEKLNQVTHYVTYHMIDGRKCVLEGVESKPFNDAEKEEFANFIEEMSRVNQSRATNSASNSSTPPLIENEFCKRYEGAINAEIKYVRGNGGRKYRVTNGRLINSEKKKDYAYVFELETELHLAESSPVTLQVNEQSIPGELLLCEDFTLVVIVQKNLGDNVSLAYITAEPWKLLEFLKERLRKFRVLERDSIARLLVEQGPRFGNKSNINMINRGQENAIDFAKHHKITVIWGPPGTGKTFTMSKLALDFIEKGKKVLILSHSNVSVDGVIKKIVGQLGERGQSDYLTQGRVLRYGYVRDEELNRNNYATSFNYVIQKFPSQLAEKKQLEEEKRKRKKQVGEYEQRDVEIDQRLKQIRVQLSEYEKNIVRKADILATTISKTLMDKVFEDEYYDVVMFDEASMAYVPHIVSAAMMATQHFICVGDFMQLAPISQAPNREELGQDIFSFLNIIDQSGTLYNHDWLVMLNVQRRMHPDIAGYSNQYVYHGMLENSIDIKEKTEIITSQKPFQNSPITMLNIAGTYCAALKNRDNSRFNLLSGLVSFYTAIMTEQETNASVAIITPYAAQTRLIRAMILDYRKKNETNIICSTVHQFQGSECDSVIFDAVESYPSLKPGWLMLKNDNYKVLRLMNVAVTRAKSKLITVCNQRFWERKIGQLDHPFHQLLQYESRVGTTVTGEGLKDHLLQIQTDPVFQFYQPSDNYYPLLYNDMKYAKKEISVTIPDGAIENFPEAEFLEQIQTAKERGIEIKIAVRHYSALPQAWKPYCKGNDEALLPMIIIDKKILWYGTPTSKAVFEDKEMTYYTSNSFIVRFVGEHVIDLISSLSSLDRTMSLSQDKVSEEETQDLGLKRFIHSNYRCSACKSPMNLVRGRTGKSYLQCSVCDHKSYLRADTVNDYIYKENVRCTKHHCSIEAKVGQYGVYIQCNGGGEPHYLKPDEI